MKRLRMAILFPMVVTLWTHALAAKPPEDEAASDSTPALGSPEKAQSDDELTGNWGGLRDQLKDDGIKFEIGYKAEAAANLSGGTRRMATEVGQLDLGVTLDLSKIAGIDGATIQSSITKRNGPSLNTRAGLNFLEEPQETYGRGQTWRWTELWYQQRLDNDHIIFKIGRLAGGEFNNWGCDFTSLAFCGSQVGTTNTYLWYNWPIAEWGGWIKLRNDHFYIHTGINEDNLQNLNTNFFAAKFSGARGIIAHGEAGWTPHFGGGRLAGYYQAGFWYDTARYPDTLLDANGAVAALSGQPFAQRKGQTGFYVQFEQQLTGQASVDPVSGLLKPKRGLTLGGNYEHGDPRTATTLDALSLEMLLTAPFAGRPHDQIGLAIGRSRVTARETYLASVTDPSIGPRKTEYRAELFYRASVMRGVIVRPNIQYVSNPGGYSNRPSATVIGIRTDIKL